ncbi:Na+/H+ antiporter subunit A [Asanoa sp. WMMD1127]|uniref:Na+/H+ antiporter subunit A n=1 Tax=Asanoa sp. WMMD1127 TaxID=3016107 RepID=UPI002416FB7A|nr:Na+/H+ antiporter subunit A [Asanoa sp. WMMD1127]MDG4824646.1 Na+/H+ antiporter subunit A [Asanoa sp. WMMD1127]
MLALVVVHAVVAVAAPALVRWLGRRALYLVALAPLAALCWALALTNRAAVVETYTWVPDLGLAVDLRMATLSWLMVVLVGGIGALVLIYSARYFPAGTPGLGRYAGVFVAFAGAMFGLVVSDNLLLLYVFWELTTIFSYLLIAQDPTRRKNRRAATQALLVTTLGGLAMLAGFVILGQVAGSFRWSEIERNPPPGGGLIAAAVVLIVIGALSKSAIFPFSFWLPSAMAAPTPVSAYLHAAAMVKAGVFLVALLGPALGADQPWRPLLLVTGVVTMLLAGWTALRQHDLKLLLAYGTVSQLGLLTAVFGGATHDAGLAGAAQLLAHALFKSTLFLVVGIIDVNTGTRDLRELSGLGRRAPWLAAVAVLAGASMAGLPPFAGFVGKEAAYAAFLHGNGAGDLVVLAALVLGSVLTVAYTLRFLWGAFADKPGVATTTPRPIASDWLAGPAVLAVAGLGVGAAAAPLGGTLAPYADLFPDGGDYHLAVWHGFNGPLGLSVLALVAGAALFAVRHRIPRAALPFDGDTAYWKVMGGLDRTAVELTGATQRGSLPFYLVVILLALVAGLGGILIGAAPWPDDARAWDTSLQVIVGGGIVVAAVAAVRALRRLTAMILVGVSGYGVAVLFILQGAPDLALTQFLVETATIAMVVLVLRRLPAKFSERPIRTSRLGRIAVGIGVGAVAAGMTYVAVGAREAAPVSEVYAELAPSFGGGDNIVNVILVDIRAWDTMGEIAVLVVAATGVASLIFRRSEALRRRRGVPGPEAPPGWLRAGPSGESIILQVVTRLVFHTIVLFSIFLLFSGHNAPGGGFAGGLVAGLALAVRYLAGGQAELHAAAPVDAGAVLGAGLVVAVGTGVLAMLAGGQVLQSAIVDRHVPVLGDVHLVTSIFFDIGVYLVVVGLMLDVLRSLGGEIDRQGVAAG